MKLLSICIITRNEEKNIRRLLESLANLADEIIILDTGSDDQTLEIIELISDKFRLPVSLYQANWKNDFSKARNECIKHAKGDWILILDADEELSNSGDFRSQIHSLIKENIYALPVINYKDSSRKEFINRQFGQRLFANNKFRFEGVIHERPVKKDNTFYEIKKMEAPVIFHYGYHDNKSKAKRNLNVIEANLSAKKSGKLEEINLISLVIPEYLQLELYTEAAEKVEHLETLISDMPIQAVYALPFIHLAYIYFLMAVFSKNPHLFAKHIEKALKYFPDSLILNEYMAQFLYRQGKFEECKTIWLKIQQMVDSKTYYPYYKFHVEIFKQKCKQALILLQR